MNTRRSTLIGSAVAFALFSQSSWVAAQSASTPAEGVEEVIVTGIRASLQQSLEVKRDANARLEVVTAEEVGKLPAHNVADTLRGLPGVNISSSSADEGGFDEADRVSLRGTSPSLTQTLINGHSVGSADWFVLSHGNNVGRSVSYSLLPSELVSSVEVNKSSNARLQEGGTTGTVNIITRKVQERWGGSLTVSGTLQEDRDYGASHHGQLYLTGPLVPRVLGLTLRGSFFERFASDLTYLDEAGQPLEVS